MSDDPDIIEQRRQFRASKEREAFIREVITKAEDLSFSLAVNSHLCRSQDADVVHKAREALQTVRRLLAAI